MPARLIDGKAVSDRRRLALGERVRQIQTRGVQPCLAAVTVRPDGGWTVYQRGQAVACAQVGVVHRTVDLPADGGQDELSELIESLNLDPLVHGIIVQNPLPSGFDALAVSARISPDKDVEGMGPANLGLVLAGRATLAPCTALAALALAKEALGELAGVEAVVIGASTIVGKPLASLLTAAGATVTLCQITTRDVADHARRADLVVVAVGKPGLVQAGWIKPGAVVVDVGINRVAGADGKMVVVGDVDPRVGEVAGWLTPVPGGVGAMTTTILLESTVAAAERLHAAPDAVDAASVSRILGGLDLPTAMRERVALLLSRHLPAFERSGGVPLASQFARRLSGIATTAGALVLDGAMGSELISRGIAPSAVGRANREHPDLVLEVHRASLAAGASVLTTNTFPLNRYGVPDREELARLLAAGVRLARQAAVGKNVYVIGSMGPLGQVVGAEIDLAQAEDAYAEVALALIDGQVDGLILETMPSTVEATAALAGVRRVTRLPVIACRVLLRGASEDLGDFVQAMEHGGADAIGVNCAGGPRITRLVGAALARMTRLPVCARPNAGHPGRDSAGRPVYHLKPAYFAGQMRQAISDGIGIIGGCCGIAPSLIAAIAPLAGTPVPRASNPMVVADDPGPGSSSGNMPVYPWSDRFPMVALLPGRLPVQAARAAFTTLAQAGIDAFGLSSGWPGSQRGGRLVAQLSAVQNAITTPAILEWSGDMSLAAAEEQLLAADLLGVGIVLIDAGVFAPPTTVDLRQLLWLVRQLNHGRDRSGNRLERPTNFIAGVRLPTSDERWSAYVAAGAVFFTLQPVYQPAVFRARMAQLAECPVPVLGEALLLPDAATAEELDNELPALAVPPALVQRLAEDVLEDAKGVLRFLRAWREPRAGFARLAGVVINLPDERTAQAVAVITAMHGLRAGP